MTCRVPSVGVSQHPLEIECCGRSISSASRLSASCSLWLQRRRDTVRSRQSERRLGYAPATPRQQQQLLWTRSELRLRRKQPHIPPPAYTAPRSYGDNTVARQRARRPRDDERAAAVPTRAAATKAAATTARTIAHPTRPQGQPPAPPVSGSRRHGSAEQPSSYARAAERRLGAAPVGGGGTAAAVAPATRSRSSRATRSIRCRAAIRSRSRSSCPRTGLEPVHQARPEALIRRAARPQKSRSARAAAELRDGRRRPAESTRCRAGRSPAPEAAEAPADWTGSHTVKPGESLYAIAREEQDQAHRARALQRHRRLSQGEAGHGAEGAGNDGSSESTVASNADSAPSSAPLDLHRSSRAQSMAEALEPAADRHRRVAPAMLNGGSGAAAPGRQPRRQARERRTAPCPMPAAPRRPRVKARSPEASCAGRSPARSSTHVRSASRWHAQRRRRILRRRSAPMCARPKAVSSPTAGDELKGYGNLGSHPSRQRLGDRLRARR